MPIISFKKLIVKPSIVWLFVMMPSTYLFSRSLDIIKNSRSEYVLLLSAQPSPAEKRAADILAEYFFRMSGARLSILQEPIEQKSRIISIGQTQFALQHHGANSFRLGQDGFRILTQSDNVFLIGGTRHGIVYAATALLEDFFGCRKWNAKEEYVPVQPNLFLPETDTTYLPATDIRVVNGPMAEDAKVKEWRRVTTIGDDWREGDWKGYYVHTFNRLVPPSRYFETHPEYFGLINGERKPYAQLCLTNPDVLERVIDTLRAEMAAHPGIHYWSVSQNDDFEYCRCANCEKVDEEEGSPSGLILRFVNKVAAAFPEKTITTLAYSYTRHAPRVTRPAANVMITLCSIEMDRSETIAKSTSGESFVNDLHEWHAISDNLMIWDYEVQFTNYISPFPLFHTLQPNLQLFDRNGAKAHFQQCYVDRGVEFAELKLFVLSKLLWNPDANVDSMVNDFMMSYYGSAGTEIKSYFDDLHRDEQRTHQSLDIYGTPVAFATTLLTLDRLNEYKGYFDRAERKVANDPVLLNRVKIAHLPLLFAEMEIAKTDLFGERGWFYRDGDDFKPRPEKTALLDTFTAVCKRNDIVYMNENGLTVELYRTSTERFLDVRVKGDLAFEKSVSCTTPPDQRYFLKGPASLTDGVRGTERYRMNWLGWEGVDVGFTVDLGTIQPVQSATVSTMHYPQAWIVRPEKVVCSVSDDGVHFKEYGEITTDQDASKEPLIRAFDFSLNGEARYVRFEITGTKTLPAWHTYTGHKSWVFIDELVVR
jgi:hypothetical protein